jgi:hypothetical protein
MVMVSLPYIVVKVFKRRCYLRCLEKKKMNVLAKIWLITTSHYSFDAWQTTRFKCSNILKKHPSFTSP